MYALKKKLSSTVEGTSVHKARRDAKSIFAWNKHALLCVQQKKKKLRVPFPAVRIQNII